MAKPPEPRSGAPVGDRIAKLLARAGIASRREVERMIAEGRVALDGTPLDTPATVLRSLAGVTVDGKPVAQPEPARLFLYHKPTGLLVTERDPKGRPTIYDRLPRDLPRLVPVGRLDLNTEGLLLLTTDGGFKRQLELPATGVERSYRARAYGNVTQAQLEDLADGVEIEGIRYGSIDANIERRTGANVWIEITITEGKNREVRRVLEHLGLQVSRLIRTRYGPFVLGDLPLGGIGEVKQHEIVAFRRTLKGGAPDEPVAAPPRPGFRTPATTHRAQRTRPAPATKPRAVDPPRPGFRTAATTDRAARIRNRPEREEGDRIRTPRPFPNTGRSQDDRSRGRSQRADAQPSRGDRPIASGSGKPRDGARPAGGSKPRPGAPGARPPRGRRP